MAKTTNSAPQGMAGLTRFSDDDVGKIKIRPSHVIIILIIVVIIVFLLHVFGNAVFNIPTL